MNDSGNTVAALAGSAAVKPLGGASLADHWRRLHIQRSASSTPLVGSVGAASISIKMRLSLESVDIYGCTVRFSY